MRRHLTQPLHTGVLHRRIGIEALGDGMGDHRLPLFLEQLDQPLLLGDQPVDFGGFMVEEVG